MGKEMDLKMQILARGQQALAVLRSVEDRVTAINKRTGELAHVAGKTFGAFGNLAGYALRPLKWAVGAAMGLAAALTAVGTKALFAAAGDQALTARLEAMYGSTEKAKRKFQELEKLSRYSPFTPDELVDATIVMEQYGLGGSKSLKTVEAAAKAAGIGIGELALQVSAMQARGLKRFGIEMDEKDGRTTFQFRDRMQKIRKVVATGAEEARQTLLKIFDVKFGGQRPETFNTMFAGMKNTLEQAFATIGEGMLPIAQRFVDAIRERLATLIDSGKLTELGDKIGARIELAWDYATSIVEKVQAVLDNIKDKPEKQAQVVREILMTAAQMAAIAFVNYLRAVSGIFIGIGKLIGGAVMEDVLQLPGMGLARAKVAADRAKTMTENEGVSAGIPREAMKMIAQQKAGKLTKEQEGMLSSDFLRWSNENPEAAAKLSSVAAGKLFADGITQVMTSIPKAAAETLAACETLAQESAARINAIVGPTGPSIIDRVWEKQQWHPPLQQPEMVAVTTGGGGLTGTGQYWDMQTMTVPGSWGYRPGQDAGGGYTVINVQNLNVRANDTEALRNAITVRAGAARPAAASTE